MLVVKVELHSANTGEVTELGRMIISNDGSSDDPALGSYDVRLARKGVSDNRQVYLRPQRRGRVEDHLRNALPVWSLVARALGAIGFRPRKVDIVPAVPVEEPDDVP